MAFKNRILNQVNRAFDILQDLAEDISFTNVTDVEYDFNNSEASETVETTKIIKGVITKMYKDINDNTILLSEVIIKTVDASGNDLDNYDTITFRNKNWNINSLEDNGFSVTIIAARKV